MVLLLNQKKLPASEIVWK